MDIAFLLFVPFLLWGMGFSGKGFRQDYISVMSTKALKGILAVLVVFHHMSRQLEGFLLPILDNVGVLCVCVFFFLSGYGLQRSYATKPGYRSSILRKRIPSVLVPYLILTLIYWAVSPLRGETLNLSQVLLSFFNSNPLVDYSWYILCILVFYVNYYISTFFFPPQSRGMAACHAALSIAWVILCRRVGYDYYWYNGAIAFPMGILWASEEKRLVGFFQKHYLPSLLGITALFGVSFLGALYTAVDYGAILPLFWTATGLFPVLVMLVLMKFSFRNPALSFLGDISFEIYGIHGLFLWLYRSELLYIENDILWCLAVVLSTIAAAWGLHQMFRKILK